MSDIPVTSKDLRHLRPTTIPEMLDRAFLLMRAHWPLLLLLAVLASVSEFAFVAFRFARHGNQLDQWQVSFYVGLYLLSQLPFSMAVAYVFQRHLFPQRAITMDTLIKAILPRFPGFLLTQFILQLATYMLTIILPVTLITQSGSGNMRVLYIALAAACAVLGIRLMIHWSIVPVVILAERKTYFNAAIRSSELMSCQFHPRHSLDTPAIRAIVGFLPLLIVMATIIAAVEAVCINTHKPLLNFSDMIGASERAAAYLTWGLTNVFTMPYFSAFMIVLYLECRMRRDGMDFQVRLIESGFSTRTADPTELTEI